MHFTLYQDTKKTHLSDTARYHTEAIKSVPVTEKHEKPLMKIL